MIAPKRIVFEGKSKKGNDVLIRYPNMHDAPIMQAYINDLSREKTFIRFRGEQVSIQEEEEFLKAQLGNIAENTGILLLAFCNDELVGVAGLDMLDKTERHVGVFGISVAKNFRKEGIGSLLTKFVIDEAEKNIAVLEIITLCVFSNNEVGLEMYRKTGFVEYGRLPRGIKLGHEYVDQILMYRSF